jgi:nucleotide-binding universal stress UspA family protein
MERPKIVCATRGGEACRRTQEKAIALAKERDAELIFLYVVDPNLVGQAGPSLAEAMHDEMERLGRSLLYMAQSRARKKGIEAEAVVRHGEVQEGIRDFMRETGADTLVMGCPRVGVPPQAFTQDAIGQFAETVRQELGAQVIVVS